MNNQVVHLLKEHYLKVPLGTGALNYLTTWRSENYPSAEQARSPCNSLDSLTPFSLTHSCAFPEVQDQVVANYP